MAFVSNHEDQPSQGCFRPLSQRKFKPKVKTGCRTCRIRRVKCDEGRPACHRCLSTGRVCDGYPSVFRVFTPSPPAPSISANSEPSLSLYQPRSSIITADQIIMVAHYFHRKPRVNVCYQNEARAVLENLSDPAIRHALDSLSRLHDGLEQKKHSIDRRGVSASMERSLDAYNAAVSSLASRLRDAPTSRASALAALVCCQMFISIEVITGDYGTAFKHLLQGLRIMHQYRNRAGVTENGRMVSCYNTDFPHLDAFAIKLFASGYPGPRHLSTGDRAHINCVTNCANALLCDQGRSDLDALSVQALDFLNQLTDLRGRSQVPELLARRAQILGSLQSWEQMYSEIVQGFMGGITSAKVFFGSAFSLLLHRVLKVVVGLTMNVSPVDTKSLDKDFHILAEIASLATKKRVVEMNRAKGSNRN